MAEADRLLAGGQHDLALIAIRGLLGCEDTFTDLGEVAPSSPDLHFKLAQIYAEKGDFEKAEYRYDTALREYSGVKPKQIPVYINMAQTHEARGWTWQAVLDIKAATKLIQKYPTLVDAETLLVTLAAEDSRLRDILKTRESEYGFRPRHERQCETLNPDIAV